MGLKRFQFVCAAITTFIACAVLSSGPLRSVKKSEPFRSWGLTCLQRREQTGSSGSKAFVRHFGAASAFNLNVLQNSR